MTSPRTDNLLFLMGLSIAACGGGDSNDTTAAATTDSQTTTTTSGGMTTTEQTTSSTTAVDSSGTADSSTTGSGLTPEQMELCQGYGDLFGGCGYTADEAEMYRQYCEMLFEGADPACISALEDWFACVNPTSCEELAEGCNAEALARGQACDEGDTDGSASSTGVDTVGGTDTGGTTG